LVLFVAALSLPQGSGAAKATCLSLCEILASPEKFYEKEITVRAVYRASFEASELYCSECLTLGQVWVEFEDTKAGSRASSRIGRRTGPMGAKLNGVFTGILRPQGVYGHLGSYRFEMILSNATGLRTVDRMGVVPKTEDPKCCPE
jgi:hypothetical protein